MSATDEEIISALAEEMREARVGYYTTTAEILLPVVRRIAEQRAAEELRDAADLLTDRVRVWVLDLLHNRADVVEAGGER